MSTNKKCPHNVHVEYGCGRENTVENVDKKCYIVNTIKNIKKGVVSMGDVLIKTRTRNNGKVVYEYRFEIASVDGKRKWKTKSGFPTKTAAKEAGKLAQQIYENTGVVKTDADMSYADFLAYWIDKRCKLTCKKATVDSYNKKIRLYINPKLGEYRLKSITTDTLQEFINELFDDGFSPNSIAGIKGVITNSFKFAVSKHYITTSPANDLIIPVNLQPKNKTRQKPHIYIPEEKMDKIFERFPEGHPSYLPLLIAYHTGTRLGETHAIVWDDIDFDNKTISISRQVQWHSVERMAEDKKKYNGTSKSGGYWYFNSPKFDSYRIIDIDDTLFNALKKEKERQEYAQKFYAENYTYYYAQSKIITGGIKPEELVPAQNKISTEKTDFRINFVCRRENGTFISPGTARHLSRIVHSELNFPEFDIHSLRHTHATMLVENGADMVYVQKRLGHKDLRTTMAIYANHITPKIKERNINMLNNIFDN